MDFFNIHTHASRHPETEIVSYDVGSLPKEQGEGYISVGIHPWYLTETNADNRWNALKEAVQNFLTTAIGEGGIDKLKGPSTALQMEIFRKEAILAEEHSLPMVIHCVKAFNELIRLKQEIQPRQPWIIHGFRGKKALAMECIRHGFYLSFGTHFQEDVLPEVPLERLFIETDESEESIENIYRRIAQSKGIPVEELQENIKKNIRKVFFKS